MDFQIVTDSCCDFTDAEYSAMKVACVPLSVMLDGQCHDHCLRADRPVVDRLYRAAGEEL